MVALKTRQGADTSSRFNHTFAELVGVTLKDGCVSTNQVTSVVKVVIYKQKIKDYGKFVIPH